MSVSWGAISTAAAHREKTSGALLVDCKLERASSPERLRKGRAKDTNLVRTRNTLQSERCSAADSRPPLSRQDGASCERQPPCAHSAKRAYVRFSAQVHQRAVHEAEKAPIAATIGPSAFKCANKRSAATWPIQKSVTAETTHGSRRPSRRRNRQSASNEGAPWVQYISQ